MYKYNEAIAKFDTNIDDERVKYEVEKILDEHYKENCTREVYSFILSCLDLTSLNITDNDETITAFVSKVNDFENTCPDMNPVAAICVYPNFVTTVRAALDVSSVKIASVAGGFPSAQTYSELKTVEAGLALHDGADEIDMVMNIGNFLGGNYQELCDEISEMKETCHDAKLKVIIETGVLPSMTSVMKASILALYSGADFIKTSTGKSAVGATPEAVYVMAKAVKEYSRMYGTRAGIKVAGGVRTAAEAVKYYTIIKEVLGEEWLTSEYFRIGASSLADSLLSAIEGKEIRFFSK